MYAEETLDPHYDDGTMVESKKALEEAVVGHRIVSVHHADTPDDRWSNPPLIITLDNGKQVEIIGGDDCCAYTEVQDFILNADKIDHIITGVGTTDYYNTWHIYADMGDVLKLKVGWSSGNPFYYGYGFEIQVRDIEY